LASAKEIMATKTDRELRYFKTYETKSNTVISYTWVTTHF